MVIFVLIGGHTCILAMDYNKFNMSSLCYFVAVAATYLVALKVKCYQELPSLELHFITNTLDTEFLKVFWQRMQCH